MAIKAKVNTKGLNLKCARMHENIQCTISFLYFLSQMWHLVLINPTFCDGGDDVDVLGYKISLFFSIMVCGSKIYYFFPGMYYSLVFSKIYFFAR